MEECMYICMRVFGEGTKILQAEGKNKISIFSS